MRIVVTGGAGFIGSYVVKHLLKHDRVCVADRFTYAGKARNLGLSLPQIDILFGDLASGDLPDRIAEYQPDAVVHMAAETHVDYAIGYPERFIRSNVMGTTRLLHALATRCKGLQRVVVYSTDEVYGSTPAGQIFDEQTPFNPSNAYAASKVGIEAMARAFFVTHGLPIVVVRPCNTYGPRQHHEKVIPKFVRQVLNHVPITLYNDGLGSRDWLHGTDHAAAIDLLMRSGEPGEAYNLAAGDEHTDFEIADRIIKLIGKGPEKIVQTPGRPGHDRRYRMTGDKLRAMGWRPQVPFSGGFAETVQWNVDHQDWWAHDLVPGGLHG